MSPDCGLKTQIVLHSSGTKPRLKLQQRVNLVGTLGGSQRNPTQSYQRSAALWRCLVLSLPLPEALCSRL